MRRGARWMRGAVVALAFVVAWLALPAPADAHVGSPDVFFEGDAGPYHVFVTVRVPQVIPGIATIEIRSSSPDARDVTVVPMRLTGPGSQLPPTPDAAVRSPDDPQFFTASLWLMEHGSLQVRVAVDGLRGRGMIAVPVPAVALRTLAMDRSLGGLLFGIMLVLALSLVSIVVAAVGESTLEPGAAPRSRRRVWIATAIAGSVVVALLVGGNAWWSAEAEQYAATIYRPWQVHATRDGCQLRIAVNSALLDDHGHKMHLFLIAPGLDRLLHLHPTLTDDGDLVQTLPSLPAGRYQVFADIVRPTGFPVTGTGQLDVPALTTCGALTGDDSAWTGAEVAGKDSIAADLPDGGAMIWDRPHELRANAAIAFRFHVVDRDGKPATDLEPYMGMAAHAEVVATDMSVFAHLHPDGSVAMPAMELAQRGASGDGAMGAMPGMDTSGGGSAVAPMPGMVAAGQPISPEVTFPYGFPKAGAYRVFVQIKRAGAIETAAFDANVEP